MQEFTNEPGIYKCTCLSNSRSYIGQTRFLMRRKNDHIRELRNNRHSNRHFQNAWNKYGEENFTWKVIEYCSVELLDEREIYWIEYYDSFKSGFNLTTGGSNGCKYSEESRRKHREKMLGEKNPMYGKTGKLNPAYGRNMSGENSPSYGKHHTEEAKEKNRQAHLGRNNVGSKPVICIETNELFFSMQLAGAAKNCDPASIGRVCKGKRLKTCGGYHWRFATQEDIELYDTIHNNKQNQINNIAS